MRKMKKTVFIELILTRASSIILQLIFLKIYSSSLTIYELGIFYLFMAISYSFNAFFLVPLDYFQQSKLISLKIEEKSLTSFYSINIFILKSSLILLLITESSIYFIDKELMITGIILISFSLLVYINNLLRNFLNNLEYQRDAVYTLLVENILKILLFVTATHYFTASSSLLFLTLLISMIISSLILITIITKKKEFKFSDKYTFYIKDVFFYTYPISFGSVINWIQLQSYRMILAPMGYVEIIGLYATVANVGHSGMNAAAVVYSQLFSPTLYKTHGQYIKRYISLSISIIIGVLFIGTLFSREIVSLVINDNFIEYSYLIYYGILAEGGNFLIGGLSIYITIHSLTKKIIIGSFIGLFSFLFIFYLLYSMNLISIWSIGLPIILSQLFTATYLYFIAALHYKRTK